MASNPIGREAAPVTLPGTIPHMPAVARILSRYDRGKLSAFVTVAIDLLDAMGGDLEAEAATWPEWEAARAEQTGLPDDSEPAGDEADAAWIEWTTKPANLRRRGQGELLAGHEDAEDDDPAGQYDEDCWTGPAMPDRGAGCPISDPGGCQHD